MKTNFEASHLVGYLVIDEPNEPLDVIDFTKITQRSFYILFTELVSCADIETEKVRIKDHLAKQFGDVKGGDVAAFVTDSIPARCDCLPISVAFVTAQVFLETLRDTE